MKILLLQDRKIMEGLQVNGNVNTALSQDSGEPLVRGFLFHSKGSICMNTVIL
ncbi:MAG: hypothetical protein Q8K98_00600 [Bacteroidota bacterium]|nr:hypothetical protein [Bacteroidota bacterium]